ncbi:LOW QUALITY PROTEIN: conserved hypothetical protein [Leishmania braziliensis MHOM/BR/75/M2904]|uniref:Uncharacterized protein n=1 Tax=Leishmania braziliensis TaxID=5660 RepID=A4HN97_LEIBR|nr:LOW QUALITY PROTEIN: conserved hypothetical protein [Leishmania braziliensis MHOM/BR/75/M2904]CAM43643.2 conserved hypothetical protein [Leishmania braziliensis MHOM/BR/75/M2904]
MIHSYHQSSSVMSTEDGSSSTVFGNPRIEQRRRHVQQQHLPRLPCSCEPFSETLQSSFKARQDPIAEYEPRRNGEGSNPMLLRNEGGRSNMPHVEGMEGGAISPPSMRTARTDLPALASPKTSAEESRALLETVVAVSTKMPPHEPQVRPLGVYVRTSRGGPNGVTRVVLVRLTDPSDPFFLFELELLEDDYSAFKQRLELLVDFHGFPRYLVGMLRDIADGASAYELSFVLNNAAVGDSNRGTLRVLETTDFKTVEHISLVLLRQGDAGLKRYLAERFQHYEQSFRASEASRIAITAELKERIDDLQVANDALRARLRKTEEEMRFMTTDAEKEQLVALNRLRDHHTKEMNGTRESFDKKIEQLSHALEEKTRQLRDTTNEKDADGRGTRSHLRPGGHGDLASVTPAQCTGHGGGADQGACGFAGDKELANFKAEATKAMSENELNYVTLAERLRGTSTALQSREEKLAALQAHYEKQDEYIRILAEQNKQQADHVREAEKNLDKAHHIIANQLQAIKNAKDRYHIAMDQLRSQETLLQEREGAARRQQEELMAATERVQELLRKNSDLREQLETINNAREQLVQEVKLSQQALLRLQQTTSINGRHWGVLSSAYQSREGAATGVSTLDATAGAGSTDFMREFGANAHVLNLPGYRSLNLPFRSSVYRSTCLGKTGLVAASGALSPSSTGAVADGVTVTERPSLFATKAASPSPVHSSQERAGSAETAGLTEPHGRGSMSSLSKTERTSGTAAASASQLPVKSASLNKQSSHMGRSSFNGLAVKSFLGGEDASQRAAVTAGPALESAYF